MTIAGLLDWKLTAVTTPVMAAPAAGCTWTVRPSKLPACRALWAAVSPARLDCIFWVPCNVLNWASCARKSVLLTGFIGSCEDSWATSSFRKSCWLIACWGSAEAAWSSGVAVEVERTEETFGIKSWSGPPFARIGGGQGWFCGLGRAVPRRDRRLWFSGRREVALLF